MRSRLFSLVVFGGLLIGAGACLDHDVDNGVGRLTSEIKQIDDYLASQGATNVLYDNTNGMRFIVQNYGRGEVPESGEDQTVKFSYTGKLFSNGQVFASANVVEKFEKITEPAGLQYCLSALLAGSSATFYLPSSVAFGTRGSSTFNVRPNSIVIYEVTLTEVQKTTAQLEQFKSDTAAIHDFISANQITNAVADPSGIWYTIDQLGSGNAANPYSVVTFSYKLSLLSNAGAVIQQNTITSNVFGLIDGLKIGFQVLQPGGTATFYIPSGLAYGPRSQSTIPANSNLIFEITLNSIQE